MKVQKCKGSRDLSPVEMTRFRVVESAFRDACLKWGYDEVRTPTIEYLHLFTATGTLAPSMLREVYSFLDWDGWSGERVVLRPDGTIPVARYFNDCLCDKDRAKLFYVTNVFRFKGTGTESRERWQCGAELIGAGGAGADVELVVMAIETLKKLDIKNVEIKLSHAGIIRALLRKLGLNQNEQTEAFDKFLNNGVQALIEQNTGNQLDKNLLSLLGMRGKSSGMLKNYKPLVSPEFADFAPALDNFIQVVELIESLGYDYQIDIDSGRGFEYYTGLIFQIFANGKKLGAGGRYDDLIPVLGGKSLPASGFALYVEPLMSLLPEAVLSNGQPRLLIRAEQTALKLAFDIARQLHDNGFKAEISLGQKNIDEYRWILDITDSESFALTDLTRSKKFKLASVPELLKALGEKSGHTYRPA